MTDFTFLENLWTINNHEKQNHTPPELIQQLKAEHLDVMCETSLAPETIGFRLKPDGKSWGPSQRVWNYPCFTRGSVTSFLTDRAPNWDHGFVIGWHQQTGDRDPLLGVIYPRFKSISTDVASCYQLILGSDRLTDPDYEYKYKCVCSIRQGDDFYCRCGAQSNNIEEYAKSFQPVDTKTTMYKVVWNKIELGGAYYWRAYDLPHEIDCLPLQSTSCISCRKSHA